MFTSGFILLGLSGCTTLDYNNYKQTVLVKSNPPGAKVYERGRSIGETPAFMRFRRRHHPQLTVELPGQPSQKLDLVGQYRWGSSFASNFVFLTLAPAGWITDYSTGTAWSFENRAQVDFPMTNAKATSPAHERPAVIGVAPPVGVSPEVASVIGPKLEDKLRLEVKGQVLEYEKTAPYFAFYGSDQGLSSDEGKRFDLYHSIKANQIFECSARPTADGFEVTGHLRDVIDERELGEYHWTVTATHEETRAELVEHRRYADYFHFLPNTVLLNFSSFSSTATIDELSYSGKNARERDFGEQAFNYLSAISFTHIDKPIAHVRPQWKVALVPSFAFSQKRIRYSDYKPLSEAEFERWFVTGGYGLEVGHLSKIGYFYFDYIPMVTWTQISYETPKSHESISRTSVTAMIELGYSYFFRQHFVAKAYVRSFAEDRPLWERAIRDVVGSDVHVSSISTGFAGVAIGYYFPSGVKGDKADWKIDSQSP